jgi:hypothetical protein
MSMNIEAWATVATASVTVMVAVGSLGAYLRNIFGSHEKQDQVRHEQNLERFGEIKAALAVLGYRNGGIGHIDRRRDNGIATDKS